MPEVDRQLGGVRSGDQVGRTNPLEELLIVHPVAAADDLVAHERNVRSRAAEADDSEFGEQARNFLQRTDGHRRDDTSNSLDVTEYRL
jgi:hypothetical protein